MKCNIPIHEIEFDKCGNTIVITFWDCVNLIIEIHSTNIMYNLEVLVKGIDVPIKYQTVQIIENNNEAKNYGAIRSFLELVFDKNDVWFDSVVIWIYKACKHAILEDTQIDTDPVEQSKPNVKIKRHNITDDKKHPVKLESYGDVLSVEEACKVLQIGRNAIYSLLTFNKLKAYKNGRVWKIPKHAIVEYINTQSNLS